MEPDRILLNCVDEDDAIVGYEDKERCHDGEGILHRAFSVYLFDDEGRLLIQRRSLGKRLWPGFWSNSCCSHPRRGEDTVAAAERRLGEELGISSRLTFAFKFRYRAEFEGRGSENEVCSVYTGRVSGAVDASPDEVLDWRLVATAELAEWMRSSPESFTPWFRLAWDRLTSDFAPRPS